MQLPRRKIQNILSNILLIRQILSVNIILHNRGCHVGYAMRLLVVVVGQSRHKTCTFLPQAEEAQVCLAKHLQGPQALRTRTRTTTRWSRGMRNLAHLSSRTLPRLSLHSLQALGNAVHLTLILQAPTPLVTRVRVRLGGSEDLWQMLLYSIMDFMDFHYELLWTIQTIINEYELLWTIIMDCVDY